MSTDRVLNLLESHKEELYIAVPVLMMDVYGHQDRPFGLLTQALDNLKPGEVYIAAGAFYRSANRG